jgi:hypothetical protein
MSKAEAVRFIEHGRQDPLVAQPLGQAVQTASAWVAVATTCGFDFTVEELRSASEEMLGRTLPGDAFVTELLARSGELSADELANVAGGAGVSSMIGRRSLVMEINDSGPSWVDSGKGLADRLNINPVSKL